MTELEVRRVIRINIDFPQKRLDFSRQDLESLNEEIGGCVSLQNLNLANNNLKELPKEIGKLSNLKILNLSNNKINKLPNEFSKLHSLERLFLSSNCFIDFPKEIFKLKELKYLNLSGNKIDCVPIGISNLVNIEILNIAKNRLEEFPNGIEKLDKLIELDLRGNRFTNLPDSIWNIPNLKKLNLSGNPIKGVKQDLLKRIDDIKILKRELQKTQSLQQLNEAKVILVGEPSVGKTSLVNRLMNDTFKADEPVTEKIEIRHWETELEDKTPIVLNMWDFGGHEIMHATHQFFLTDNSLYLLVLNSRNPKEINRVEYWLEIIQSLGGDSRILVVCNKCDQGLMHLNWRALERKYPMIKGFLERVSCKTTEGIPELRVLIRENIAELPHINKKIKKECHDIKKQLEDMPEEFISYDTFKKICVKNQLKNSIDQKELLDLLKVWGVVLHYQDDKRIFDTNVLKPEWLSDAIYKIINSKMLLGNKGILLESDLIKILDGERYPIETHPNILGMMILFKICFKLEENEGYLLPDLLPLEEPSEAALNNWQDSLSFKYKYEVLPTSIISRFIVKMRNQIEDNLYWRSGVILSYRENNALVFADSQHREMNIFIRGKSESRRSYLSVLRGVLENIHSDFNIEIQDIIPISPNHEAKIDYLKFLVESHKIKSYYLDGIPELVPVEQILKSIIPEDINIQQLKVRLSSDEKHKLVNLLLNCQSIKDWNSLIIIIEQLDPRIQKKVSQSTNLFTKVFSLVDICDAYPNGLNTLLIEISRWEENSYPMKSIIEFYNELG